MILIFTVHVQKKFNKFNFSKICIILSPLCFFMFLNSKYVHKKNQCCSKNTDNFIYCKEYF